MASSYEGIIVDCLVSGGTIDGWWTGVNLRADNRWQASVGYGNIDLVRRNGE